MMKGEWEIYDDVWTDREFRKAGIRKRDVTKLLRLLSEIGELCEETGLEVRADATYMGWGCHISHKDYPVEDDMMDGYKAVSSNVIGRALCPIKSGDYDSSGWNDKPVHISKCLIDGDNTDNE